MLPKILKKTSGVNFNQISFSEWFIVYEVLRRYNDTQNSIIVKCDLTLNVTLIYANWIMKLNEWFYPSFKDEEFYSLWQIGGMRRSFMNGLSGMQLIFLDNKNLASIVFIVCAQGEIKLRMDTPCKTWKSKK